MIFTPSDALCFPRLWITLRRARETGGGHCSVVGADTVGSETPDVGSPLTLAAVTAAHSRQIGMPGQSICAGVRTPRSTKHNAQGVVESGIGSFLLSAIAY
jgi:hypothetical protein